ncbi:MAG: hypothetical protein FWG55_01415 [Candidatus Bathyarchaeota archaeon]|nr:hypothetical protein [Candidatus Termiticorpusculum sp.]
MESKVDDLIIPSKDEAKRMIAQYPEEEGANEMVNPLSYNLSLAVDKDLCLPSGFSEMYLYMQALYRKALEQYLSELLDLKTYDDILTHSEMRFIPILNNKKDFYQKYSTFGFSYIYLRNNLPIERLNRNDLEVLKKHILNGTSGITNIILTLVIRTYSDIILAYDKISVDTPIGYSSSGNKIAPNNALVFEIRHSIEFNKKGCIVNLAHENTKNNYLKKKFAPMMETKLTEKLGKKIVIFSSN